MLLDIASLEYHLSFWDSYLALRVIASEWSPNSVLLQSMSFFNLQDVKGVWLDQCHISRSRAYDLKCQVAIIRLPEHDARRQSKAATAQCRPCAHEDVQRNRRRTRTCIICFLSSGGMLYANWGYHSMIQSAWPRRSHYQPVTSNTHLVAQKTWRTANHWTARAQWWAWMINQCPTYRTSEVDQYG